jgi:antitoxin component HigA of HigAB toxin-antitoxin module
MKQVEYGLALEEISELLARNPPPGSPTHDRLEILRFLVQAHDLLAAAGDADPGADADQLDDARFIQVLERTFGALLDQAA